MREKSRLEELSMALPEQERKDLLERIARRMEQGEGEEAFHIELRDNERDTIISREMEEAGLWVRFLVWLRTFLTGRAKKDVFVDLRVKQLKAHIQALAPGLTGFETRDLSPKLARKLFQVYQRARPLEPFYHALGTDKTFKGEAYSWLVEKRLEDSRTGLQEFITDEEMEEIFASTGQTEDIRKKLALRINEYARGIPETLLLELEEQARIHVYIGRLISFPFSSLFRYFNCVGGDEEEEEKQPAFEHAPAMLTLDLLERLSVTFSLLQGLPLDSPYAEEPVEYYLLVRAGLKPREETDSSRIQADLVRLRSDISDLLREIGQFERSVPLLDIVRYFRADPWYEIIATAPQLYLRSLFFTALKTRLAMDLELTLGSVKEKVIGKKIHDVLKGARQVELPNLKETAEDDLQNQGLPYITCVRSLTFLYNYLQLQFKGTVQDAAQIVAATALANNRIMQNRLTQGISNLEDLEARIVLFDRSLSPDEDDGKQLARFRSNLATDLPSQKSYRTFIIEKDREGRDLIEKARENMAAVLRIFDEVRMSTFETTRAALKTLHMYRGRNQTLGQIVTTRSEAIATFLHLLDQLVEVEKGD